MKFPLIKLAFVLIFVFVSSGAIAIVIGGSNLDMPEYPSHTCSPPSKPTEHDSFNEQWEVDQYNSEVENYNLKIRLYRDCIRKYVDNAKNDAKRVKEKITEAINEANSQ